jgi:hypothetical protein
MSRTGDAVCIDITIIGTDGGKNCAAGAKNALGKRGQAISVQRSAISKNKGLSNRIDID